MNASRLFMRCTYILNRVDHPQVREYYDRQRTITHAAMTKARQDGAKMTDEELFAPRKDKPVARPAQRKPDEQQCRGAAPDLANPNLGGGSGEGATPSNVANPAAASRDAATAIVEPLQPNATPASGGDGGDLMDVQSPQ